MAVHWLAVTALLVPLGMAPLLANVVAFAIAFNVSYFGHHNWTFAGDHSHRETFWRFLTVALASFALNEAMYFVLLQYLDYRIALAIVLLVVAALTFALSRLWAFRQAPASRAD